MIAMDIGLLHVVFTALVTITYGLASSNYRVGELAQGATFVASNYTITNIGNTAYRLRPVVTLPSSAELQLSEGTNSIANPHQINY